MQSPNPRMLNIGCGVTWHPEWVNLDLIPAHPSVIKHDLAKPLPFPDKSFDVVYHSHVLEHLEYREGIFLLSECHRILKPHGILRIVVPDLEYACRSYLHALENYRENNDESFINYEWSVINLIDQMVRTKSEGRVVDFLSKLKRPIPDFVDKMLDPPLRKIVGSLKQHAINQSFIQKLRQKKLSYVAIESAKRTFYYAKSRFYFVLFFISGGPPLLAAYKLADFRSKGEIHQWMYDKVGLAHQLSQLCFDRVQFLTPDESSIPDFKKFELDVVGGGQHENQDRCLSNPAETNLGGYNEPVLIQCSIVASPYTS